MYHEFNEEEQLAALEQEKKILEERKKLKEAGVIGSTMEALDGAASLVGTGIGAGFGAVGSGLSKAGRFVSRTITGGSSGSSKSGSSKPSTSQENGDSKVLTS